MISVERVTKRFGMGESAVVALDDVSVTISENEFFTLLGPSGCGKTTLLRLIAGFELPNKGLILLDGQEIGHLPPYRRPVNTVFQNYALFPHMTVAQNIGFGLEMLGKPAAEIADTVGRMLALVRMEALADRRTDQLSGGQQQRVALARALITEPKVLLFDEPLSNLDAKLRAEMRGQIRAIQRRVGLTSIYVTHDQAEAMALSDRIVVMHAGRIEQVGPPAEIYGRPATRFVADFLGRVNFLEAEPAETGRARLRLGAGLVTVVVDGDTTGPGPWLAVLRPEALALEPAEGAGPDQPRARVRKAVFLGSVAEYEVEVDGAALLVSAANPLETGLFAEDDVVALRLTARPLVLVRGNAR